MRLFLKKAWMIWKKAKRKSAYWLRPTPGTGCKRAPMYSVGQDWIGVADFQYGVPRRPSEHGDDGASRAASAARCAFRVARTRWIGFEKSFPSLNGQRQQLAVGRAFLLIPAILADRYRRIPMCTYPSMYVRVCKREYIFFGARKHFAWRPATTPASNYASINTHSFDLLAVRTYMCVRINIHARRWTLYARVFDVRFRWLA